MGAQLALAMLDWDETPCALGDAFGDDYEGMMGCRALLNSLDCERAFDICTAGSRSGHRRWSKRKREAKLRLASPSASSHTSAAHHSMLPRYRAVVSTDFRDPLPDGLSCAKCGALMEDPGFAEQRTRGHIVCGSAVRTFSKKVSIMESSF